MKAVRTFDYDQGGMIAISPDGQNLVMFDELSGTVRILDLESNRLEKTLKVGDSKGMGFPATEGDTVACVITPDGKGAYVRLAGGKIVLWDLLTGEKKQDISTAPRQTQCGTC